MPSGTLAPNHFEKHLRKSSYRLTSSKPFNPSGNKNGREYHRPRPTIPTFQSENETTTGMLSPHHVAAGIPVQPLKVSFRRGGVSTTVSRSAVPAEAMRAIANAQESFVIRQKRAYDLDRQRRIKLALGSVGRLSTRTSITNQTSISNAESIKKRSKKSSKVSKKSKERKSGPVKIPAETLTRRRQPVEPVEEIKPKKKRVVRKKKAIQKVLSNIISDDEVNGDAENDKRIESATASILAVIENTIDQNKVSSKKKKTVKRKKPVKI
jgi:hypothetical protein